MEFYRFIKREGRPAGRKLALLGVLAGASNGLILAIINYASEARATGVTEPVLFLGFLIAILIVSISHKQFIRVSSREVERILHRLRADLVRRVAQSDLIELDEIQHARILTALSSEIQVISRNVPQLVNACQAALLALFGSIYLLFISFPAFLVLTCIVGIGFLLYRARSGERNDKLKEAFRSEVSVVARLRDVLDGAKEIRLHDGRAEEVVSAFDDASIFGARAKSDAMIAVAEDYVTGRSLFYVILAVEIFVLPLFVARTGIDVPKSTAAILFLLWPVNSVLLALPVMEMVNVALSNIQALRDRLYSVALYGEKEDALSDFEEIELRDVTFAYHEARGAGFEIGPINLQVRKGECVFLVGRNGFGKSTTLKVLAGLYAPTTGKILVDGRPVAHQLGPAGVTSVSLSAYRNMISAVLDNFYLFKRLYGLFPLDRSLADEVLRLLELDGKVEIDSNGTFSTLALSTGQRKRLGLFVALMEQHPILILDEWAAEQDTNFRRKFYEEIVPWIRDSGRTLIAVTHDSEYFSAADRVVSMTNGQIDRSKDNA